MTVPLPGQTVHIMTWLDVPRVWWDLHKEGRNVREMALYTTDDLRRIYQTMQGDEIKLRDGFVRRHQIVAVIRWRISWERFRYLILLDHLFPIRDCG
jgi:hypothetical protein